MLDRSPVMCVSDLMKLAHPAFCSWGTAEAVWASVSTRRIPKHVNGTYRSRRPWRSICY